MRASTGTTSSAPFSCMLRIVQWIAELVMPDRIAAPLRTRRLCSRGGLVSAGTAIPLPGSFCDAATS